MVVGRLSPAIAGHHQGQDIHASASEAKACGTPERAREGAQAMQAAGA